MSWIEKELKRRAAPSGGPRARAAAVAADSDSGELDTTSHIRDLWQRLQAANDALPPELRLRLEHPAASPYDGVAPGFSAWLRAPNGAGLGLADDAIRYVWPGRNSGGRSHNFWIHWVPGRGWRLRQRVGLGATAPVMAEYRFDERRVDAMVKSLVTGAQVKARQVRKKRLWLF